MTRKSELVLVLGATGQQGGATARALVEDGWRVRALVRDTAGKRATSLAASGIEIVPGDLRNRASIDAAVAGAYGVFSIQPSSGQPEYGVTDEDELNFGVCVADAAKAAGVEHLIYTSVAGVAPGTGVGHFESKWRIEQHIHSIGIKATILRPAPFMEILSLPLFGLGTGRLVFFAAPEYPVQFIAVEDIGRIAAQAFANPHTQSGRTFDIAGDALSGNDLAARIGRAMHRSILYSRFPADIVNQNPLIKRLIDLVDRGGAGGSADIDALRKLHPGLLTFDAWLARSGSAVLRKLFE
jgi:uncharacterized protein YbjT (DUF2867 family)